MNMPSSTIWSAARAMPRAASRRNIGDRRWPKRPAISAITSPCIIWRGRRRGGSRCAASRARWATRPIPPSRLRPIGSTPISLSPPRAAPAIAACLATRSPRSGATACPSRWSRICGAERADLAAGHLAALGILIDDDAALAHDLAGDDAEAVFAQDAKRAFDIGGADAASRAESLERREAPEQFGAHRRRVAPRPHHAPDQFMNRRVGGMQIHLAAAGYQGMGHAAHAPLAIPQADGDAR